MNDKRLYKLLNSNKDKPRTYATPLIDMPSDPQPDYGVGNRRSALYGEDQDLRPDYDQSLKPTKVLIAANHIPVVRPAKPDYDQSTRPSKVYVTSRNTPFGRSEKPDYDQSTKPSKVFVTSHNTSLGRSGKPDYDDSDQEPALNNRDLKTSPISDFGNHSPAAAGKRPIGGVKLYLPVSKDDQNKTGPMEPAMKLENRVSRPHSPLITESSLSLKHDVSDVKNLALLPVLSLDTITDCIEKRYKQDLIYTNCGEILISVNPFREVELCSPKYFRKYTQAHLSDEPHLFAVSAKALKFLLMKKQNQVILVSGESGAGKTEATKLLVHHLMSVAGSEYATLQDIIIKVNPLLEAFGNAKTTLNNNSSRFAKYLSLNINDNGKIESARIKDYMLEKSRVVHQEAGERNFHAFYAFLAGASDDTLESVFINRSDKFRIAGSFLALSREEKEYYQKIYKNQQSVFQLIKLNEEEIQDINIMIATVLHLGNIEFEDSDNDCVVIKDEIIVHNVAALLNVDVTALTKIFIERSAKIGNGQVIQLSKNRIQAEDERDATTKALYERLFGWLVIKINESLKAEKYSDLPSIGILDICGFEDLTFNSFEQICINLMNEQLQNFMNKRIIEDDMELYRSEGLEIGNVDTEGINNDGLLALFMNEKSSILTMIDEDTKSGFSTDERTLANLKEKFGNSGIFIPSAGSTTDFSIKHFAGKVTYSIHSFLKKNMDTLSSDMMDCLKTSQSTLIQDLFSVPETLTGSISMAKFHFQGSRRPNKRISRQFSHGKLSETINRSRKVKDLNIKRQTQQAGNFANRSTHIKFFRNSLKELQRTMMEAHPYFVRCIKPNDKQMASKFQSDRVKVQLQYNGVEEVARIRTCGFPFRYPKDDFLKMYEKLARVNTYYGSDHVQNIFHTVQHDRSQYKIGKTQIFLKDSVKKALDGELQKIEDEERRLTELKKQEEEAAKERERQKIAEEMFSQEYNQTNSSPGSSSLTTIAEVPTPASQVDSAIYNTCPESSSSRDTTITTTEEDSEEVTTEDAQSDDIHPEEKMNAAWDITQELTEEEERRDVHEQPILMFLKFIIYILLFVIILGTFAIQKVSFLLLVTELAPITETDPRKKELDKLQQTISYVLLIIAICVPYILGWLVTVAKLCFGNFKRPSLPTWIWIFVLENLHTVGLCLLVFRVLRHLDVIRSAMLLNAIAIIPAILKTTMASSNYNVKSRLCLKCESNGLVRTIIRNILDILAMLVQISVIPLVLLTDYFTNDSAKPLSHPLRITELVVSFILISVSQWENFTDGRFFCELGEKNWFKNAILKIRYELQMGRHYPYLVAYLWKIGLTVLLAYLLSDDISFSYSEAFGKLSGNHLKVVSAVIALVIAAFVAFYVSFGACMFQMQIVSLTIPACLATPAVIGIFYLEFQYKFLEAVTDLRAKCPNDLITDHWYHFLFGGAWWLSFLVVTRHIWRPQVDRTANMARVFLNPVYCGILTTESVMLNRRRHPCRVFEEPQVNDSGEILTVHYKLRGMNKLSTEDDDEEEEETEEIDLETPREERRQPEVHPATPMLYACATMWHETRTEMVQLLKSLHRLDRDQWIRRLANEKVQGYDPEFYNYEAHIFFDDAMEPDDDDEQVPNRWVKELVASMDVACSSVHGKPMKVHPPTKVPTPYGGQLIWQMPGENLLFVHMKDIRKIRNRKRWSQVMYMYYLLGYRHIMASKQELLERLKEVNLNQGNHGLNINEINYLLGEESALRAQNTFILALDGDTDFSPGSIKILLDRMKDDNVGAACGRIHPIGNGPMVWYQKFEYAIGHWLQKSAEHVFGCVLCSPGCFSLFRAAALMDTNVMKKYTTEPTEPGHHLQYDQGEDRWLCTLMLQQGYRIEYAAAADAWTFAPEGFFEFFNQRRRWMPSTIANILDLLGSATMTTKRNANMSRLYIGYQYLLMLMTVLGPGTIIMMIAGAVKLVFQFSLVGAYLFATIPAAFYTLLCFWCSSKIQLIVAAILSVIYTFIMMIVLVGTIITATTENIFNPSVIVIVMLIGIFMISGFCHPQEIWCLVHGIMYLLTIPSGYLLLVIYSICNLNDVSWGTREVPTKAQRLEMEKKKKEKEEQEKNKPKRGFLAKLFNRGEEHIRELTKLVKTLVPHRAGSPQQQLGMAVHSTEAGGEADNQVVQLLSKIEFNLEQLLMKTGHSASENAPLCSVVVSQPKVKQQGQQQSQVATSSSIKAQPAPESESYEVKRLRSVLKKNDKVVRTKKPRDELVNPIWASDKGLGGGLTIRGNKEEIQFWKEFVTKYLLPIRPSPEEKKKIADGLKDLRNSSAFGLIIINLLWMAVNFMFQLTNAARFAIGYSYSGNDYKIEESVLGLGFVILLLLLLLIQMIGMFIHRMGTLQHLLAITEIKICKPKEDSTYNEKRNREDVIRRIKEVLKLPMLGDAGSVTVPPAPTNTSSNLGVTFAPRSNRGTFRNDESSVNFRENLDKTLKNPLFAPTQHSFMDPKNLRTMNSVRRRMTGGNVRQKLMENGQIGKTLLPHLPPRGRSVHQPMVLQANKWGFTSRELQNANIEAGEDYQPSMFNHMGPMGRTLFQKSMIINEETKRNSRIDWTGDDVYRTIRQPNSIHM